MSKIISVTTYIHNLLGCLPAGS